MAHLLRVSARTPNAPLVTLERAGQVVVERTAVAQTSADPLATATDHLAWLQVEDGDLLIITDPVGHSVATVIDQGTARVDVVDGPHGPVRTDPLPSVTLALPRESTLAAQTAVGSLLLLLTVALLVALRGVKRARSVPVRVAKAGHGPWFWRWIRRGLERGIWPTAWIALLALPVSVIGTWPMAVAHGSLVQRNFDGFGSSWLLWYLRQGTAALPRRLDTLSFALVGGALVQITDAVTAYHLTVMLGVGLSFAATAWVAQRVFRTSFLGAVVAGVAYAWCPLAGTAVAEGHGGWLLAPGLPLLIGALLWTSAQRPWLRAAWVVGAGLLCALQSGYVAVMAGLAVLVLSLAQRKLPWRIVLLSLPLALAYAWLVLPDAQGDVAGLRSWSALVELAGLLPSSDVATVDSLLGEAPGAAIVLHHARHSLGFALAAGGLVVPLLRRDRVGLILAALGLGGVVLALGPALVLTVVSPQAALPISLPYKWIIDLAPPLALFRFPVRFLWLWYASAALGTARSLTWLAGSVGRERAAAWLLAGVAVVEALVLGARPLEARTTLATVPSAYQALSAGDVVYDLWPLHAPDHMLSLELKELTCWYEVDHGASSPIPCLDVEVDRAELYRLHRGVIQLLVAGEPVPLRDLQGLGITAVAWHPDAFSPELRDRVGRTLQAWFGSPAARSADNGEVVILWRLDGAS